MKILSKLLSNSFSKNNNIKASQTGSMVAYNNIGRAVWTPRNYESLAKHGYSKNVIVYKCVNLIARSAASVPWRLYKGRQELDNHPLLELLHRPAINQAGSAFIESIIGYLLLSGNSYIELSEVRNTPKEMYVLRPDRMKIIPNSNGIISGYEYSVNGKTKIIPSDFLHGKTKILHIKLFNPLNDWYGMSPIEAAACSIDQHNAVASHNLSLLQNGGRPSGALIVNKSANGYTQGLTSEQLADLKTNLKDIVEGEKNSGRVMILDGDFSWQEMGLSPKDLDFISGKNLSAREISQAFNVPPVLLGITGDATFANYKEARLHLWEDNILPLLDLITDELNAWLGQWYEKDVKLKYDIDAIPALASKREDAWGKINQANFLTINEKRKAVGYEPIIGGDKLNDIII